MKEALISINEPRQTGYRVAQVVPDGQSFPVSIELFWTPCADDVVADQFWYDPVDQTIKPIPVPEPIIALDQPNTTGSQTL